MAITKDIAIDAIKEAERLVTENSQADMISSAELCLKDAIRFCKEGKLELAVKWAQHSIKYSAGVFCPSYRTLRDVLEQEAPNFFTLQ